MNDSGGFMFPELLMRHLRLSLTGGGQRIQRDGKVFVYESDLHSVPLEVVEAAPPRGPWMSFSKEMLEDAGFGPRTNIWKQRERNAIRAHRAYRRRIRSAANRGYWNLRERIARRLYPFADYDE